MQKLVDGYIFFHKKLDYGVWNNEVWAPLEVGAAYHNEQLMEDGFRDDMGDNISIWNPLFLENTGTYWIWKHHTDAKYTAQCQYRRRLNFQDPQDIDNIMANKKVITTKPLVFLGQTVRQQYERCHNEEDIKMAEATVKYLYPDYSASWDKYINNGNRLYYSNGFIFRTEDYDRYAEWLFNILFTMQAEMGFKTPDEHRLWIENEMALGKRPNNNGKGGTEGATFYQGEFFAFLSERLFTLYILHNFTQEEIFEVPYLKYENV